METMEIKSQTKKKKLIWETCLEVIIIDELKLMKMRTFPNALNYSRNI